jgi:peptidyl-prolyl cis-trans isomerase D
MLQSMRSGLFSKLFMAILLTGGLGLVLMDWQGVYSNVGMGGSDVAKIGDTTLSLQEFDRQVEQNLRNLPISKQDAYAAGMIQQTLQQMVSGRMIEMAAHDAGLEVGKEQLADQLRTLLSPLMTEGASSREAMAKLAQLSGVSQSVMIEDLKRREAARLLLEPMGRATTVQSKTLAEDMARIAGEDRKLVTLTLPHTRIKDLKAPSQQELATQYELMKNAFAIPEKRNAKLVVIASDEVAKKIPVSDEEITRFYDENKDAFALDQRRTLSQVVADNKDALEKLKADPAAKDDLKAAADKAGLGDKFLAAGEFKAKDLPETLSKPVFAANDGDLVGPVESDLGWHLIKISGIKGESHRTLDDARDDIITQIKQSQVGDKMETIANDLDDALAGGASLDEAIKDLPVTVKTLSSVTANSVSDDKVLADMAEADRRNIFETAFAAEEGDTAPLFALSDGRYATVVVDEIVPAVTPPLEEKKKDVIAAWEDSQRRQQNLKDAATMLSDLKDGKTDIKALATKTGISTRSITVSSDKSPPAPLTPQTVDQVMSGGVGEYLLVNDVDFVTLAEVEKITFAPTKDITAAALDAAKTSDTERFQESVYQSLLTHVQEVGNVRYNQLLLERAYNKPAAEDAAAQ